MLLGRGGVCLSTQIGCAVGCRFCKTGEGGLLRQLGAEEILAQFALAQRLNAATTYLVDVKRQKEGNGDHLGMVGEVLEALTVQQSRDFTLGPDRADDPRM